MYIAYRPRDVELVQIVNHPAVRPTTPDVDVTPVPNRPLADTRAYAAASGSGADGPQNETEHTPTGNLGPQYPQRVRLLRLAPGEQLPQPLLARSVQPATRGSTERDTITAWWKGVMDGITKIKTGKADGGNEN